MGAREFTRCFECSDDVPVDEWKNHDCPPTDLPDPLEENPYDLDRFDFWIDDDEEERDQ